MRIPRYNRISIVLDEFRMDQKDLAELLTVTKDTVSRWCRNQNQPPLPTLYRIAEIFRIDIGRLLEPTNWSSLTGPSPAEKFLEQKERLKTERKLKNKKTKRAAPKRRK